ncbi:hypothetical protein EMPS_06974 [Entomortierella parvispora]|uniref:PLP-dependent transferase n=1 Tax=Entomortierella parvispora TaxID=205924 RepID=A0A9P3HD75_9FUNG|nr:hypothetical protein EMPS_06974 [Entomortierella parvispora]
MSLPYDTDTLASCFSLVAQHAATRITAESSLPTGRETLAQSPFPTSINSSSFSSSDLESLDPATRDFLTLKLSDGTGVGLESTLDELLQRVGPSLSNCAGPRYFGLVIGGVTPAALVADWIVSLYDQNTILHSEEAMSGYSLITDQAMQMVLDLFLLPRETDGPLGGRGGPVSGGGDHLFRAMTTTGSTASNLVGMGVGRQWLGIHVRGVDYSQDGYDGQVVVVTNMAHATVWKAASILGIGRKQVIEVPSMGMGNGKDGKEEELEAEVKKQQAAGKAVMVFLAFGEVNTGIFPNNTRKVAEICQTYNCYFHIDGAFGIFARCSPKYAQLADGLELAHSITACGHKWMNVPYDCGFFLYRRSLEKSIMEPLFSSSAAYLRPSSADAHFSHPMNISIENSQRFRALPVWATLRAYGREGYRAIVEENCAFAKTMYDWMRSRPELYTVLTEDCPLNIVVFERTCSSSSVSNKELEQRNATLLGRMNKTGVAYFSPTVWAGRPAIRAAISNWKTTVLEDWEPVRAMLEEQALLL